jgi:hypothetical protein
MDPHFSRRKCKANNEECYYVPAGNLRTTAGNSVHFPVYCRNCGQREDIFLTQEQYKTQQKLILKEIKDV